MLHRRAGTRELIEVHGSIATCSCRSCGQRVASAVVLAQLRDAAVPLCGCGQPRKPDVVLFGEFLSAAALERATQLAAGADLLLCIGTSLEVYPVAQLPGITLRHGGDVAIVTQGPPPYDGRAVARLDGDVEDELAALAAVLA